MAQVVRLQMTIGQYGRDTINALVDIRKGEGENIVGTIDGDRALIARRLRMIADLIEQADESAAPTLSPTV